MWHKSKIDLEQLRIEIRNMKPRSKLWVVLKDELTEIDRWKVKSRGNPSKGYKASKNNIVEQAWANAQCGLKYRGKIKVAKRWRFTEGRKSSLRKAQREHVNLIEDGYKWRKAHGR